MINDIEIIEAPTKDELETLLQEFTNSSNGHTIEEIHYGSYNDYETKKLVYTASILLS